MRASSARSARSWSAAARKGVFRGDLDPVDVHLLISAFCFFRVSNRHTFGAIFDRDLSDPKLRKRHKKHDHRDDRAHARSRPQKADRLRLEPVMATHGTQHVSRVQYVRTSAYGSDAGGCRAYFDCDGFDQRQSRHEAARHRRRRLRGRRDLRERSADLRRRHRTGCRTSCCGSSGSRARLFSLFATSKGCRSRCARGCSIASSASSTSWRSSAPAAAGVLERFAVCAGRPRANH